MTQVWGWLKHGFYQSKAMTFKNGSNSLKPGVLGGGGVFFFFIENI